MFLILEVVGANAGVLGPAARMVFSRQGGSIGRRPGNDWVLADPHVSGRHARIRAMGGTFFLEDNESGNGVLVNGNKIHPGEPFPLKEGDVIFIDPFEIVARLSATAPEGLAAAPPAYAAPAGAAQIPPVSMQTIAAVPPPPPVGIPPAFLGVQASPAPLGGGLDDLIGPGAAGGSEFNPLLDTPPAAPAPQIPTGLDLLGKPVLNDAITIATPPPPPVRIPDPGLAARPGAGGSAIPSNWDLSDLDLPPPAQTAAAPPRPGMSIPSSLTQVLAPPGPPAYVPPAAAPAPALAPAPVQSPVSALAYTPPMTPPPAPATAPAHVPAAPAAAAVASQDLVRVLRAAGLDVQSIEPEVAAQLGQVLRTVVEGLMEVLRARGEIKSEFRVQQTTFKPRENNPLKFSANVEDALHNLLVKRNAAYLDTPSAFEDAFVDVRHHQVAMLAGMRAAFDYMLARFDPAALAAQFDAKPGSRKLSIGLGAGGRHWESFGDYYKEITRDADDCFRRLFGDQFARAYEEQLQRLRAERRRST